MGIKRIIEMLIVILSIILILWVAASYVEVISKNLNENPEYSMWNIFQVLIDANTK